MSYQPGLTEGSKAEGLNFAPGAEGGQGLLSMGVLEQQRQTRLLEEILILLMELKEKNPDASFG